MGIEVLVFVLLSTNILVQNVGGAQYGMVRSGPPSPFQARSVRRRVSVSQPEGGPVRELEEVAWKDAPRLVGVQERCPKNPQCWQASGDYCTRC
jgi:hypothetical protein